MTGRIRTRTTPLAAAAAVLVIAGSLTGCRQPTNARGVVTARRLLYVGSTFHYWLTIRQADGITVRQSVRSRTWHRCHVHDRYPGCDHRRR